tara:strand:+ start:774 stop:1049 length:276 start_codon:yes stop_codon:yes gene_type:complete
MLYDLCKNLPIKRKMKMKEYRVTHVDFDYDVESDDMDEQDIKYISKITYETLIKIWVLEDEEDESELVDRISDETEYCVRDLSFCLADEMI